MFATSTKTATFFPTVTPMSGSAGPPGRLGALEAADRPDRRQLPPEHRPGGGEPGALKAHEARRIRGRPRFDRRATLVARGAEHVLEERVRDAIRIVVRGDDQTVDRVRPRAGPRMGSGRASDTALSRSGPGRD